MPQTTSKMPAATQRLALALAAAALLVAAVLLYCVPAAADPLLETIGAALTPTPFSARIISTGSDSVYFNPTQMLDQQPGFRIGFFYLRHNLDIDYMDRPAGADIPAAAYDSHAIDDTAVAADRLRPTPTAALRNRRGSVSPVDNSYYMNVSHSVRFLDNRMAFGVHMVIPTDSFHAQQPSFADEREQVISNSLRFELYGERMRNYLFSMALAGRPVKWMSLGIGLSLAMSSQTTSRVLFQQGTAPVISPETTIHATAIPYAALAFDPIDGLKITAHFQWKHESQADTEYQQQTWGHDQSGQPLYYQNTYGFTFSSDPWRLGLGVSWKGTATPRLDYTVGGTFQWARWSEYRDRQGDTPTKPWSDTFPVTAGVLFQVDRRHDVGLDLTYVQSPVPYQDGRTNYVDNDRFGIATGYAYRLPVKQKYVLSFGASFQFHYLVPKKVVKDPGSTDPVIDEYPDSVMNGTGDFVAGSAGLQTNNPGWPGYTSSGWLMGAGVYFRFQH